MNINIRHIVHQLRKILAVTVGLFALSVMTPQAFADGTETLGVPGIAIANGTDVIISGTGLSLVQPDMITINVPAGSTVQQVLLYWEGRDTTPAGDSTVLANGWPVVGTLIGGPILWSTPPFGDISFGSSYTYRADITGLGLVGNGPSANNINIGGLSFNYVSNGAGITVVVDDGTASSSIEIRDGNDLANDGKFKLLGPLTVNTVPQTFNFAATGAERMGSLSMHVSAVQGTASSAGIPRSSAIDVTSGGVTTTHNNLLDSHNGEEWDALTVSVTIPAGATSVTAEIFSEDRLGTGDNPASLTWNAAALSIPTPPPPLARLGDRVWEDEDVDGVQDCQDTNMNGIIGDAGDIGDECGNGIPNLPVESLDPGMDGICNSADDFLLGMTMTDIDGFYSFDNLTPGTYCVRFTLPVDDFCLVEGVNLGSPQFTLQNQGNDAFDSDADPVTGVTGNIVLAAGDNDLTNDAGVVCPAKLGDRIWEDDGDGVQNCADTNGNGIIGDPGDIGPECDSGVEDVEVELLECGPDGIPGTADDVVTGEIRHTGIMGFYMFGGEPGVYDLPPGEYYTRVTKPGGTVFTTPNIGDDAFDSDCGPSGQTQCIALGSGDIDRTTDCGIITPPPQCNLILDKTCGISEPPPSNFQCDKPIDELSMIWDGPETNVSIIAYKGDTGATVLANIGGIMIGDTVTVSGFAGSPNDVTWEVFDSGMNKIGDSVFHMSCSDADMNGPEDCGKPAGDGKSGGGMGGMGGMGGDGGTDRINQWLFEGMIDSTGTLSCSAGGGGGTAVLPTEQSCSFTSASADVTYGYTVTNLGDPVTGIIVTDDQLGVIGGPVDLGSGASAQFTAMTTIFGTTINVATATGVLSNGDNCPAMDSVTIEKEVPPGSCDDGKATELVFSYVGDPCNATTQYQLDNKGNPKFTCDPSPGVPLGGLNGITIDKDAGKVSAQIIGNTVRIFRSDTLGEKLAADTRYTLMGDNGNQSQNLHTSCSKPLAVNDQFGALILTQIINEY